jgi:hypothetical protein
MRNEQAGVLENMWWLSLGEASDRFYDDMQEWWELKANRSEREWQDLTYWEVANAAMGYLEYLHDRCRDAQEERDMYLAWASER